MIARYLELDRDSGFGDPPDVLAIKGVGHKWV